MPVHIDPARDGSALDEFLGLHDRVHAARGARWPADTTLQRAVLTGRSAFAADRTFHPLLARVDGVAVARVAALVDPRYERRWGEPLGHLVLFEAMPDASDAVRTLLDEACAWLARRGRTAARTGWWPPLDDPFVTGDHGLLPPVSFRQNPPAYQTMLADAGFEPERRWLDYRAEVTPGLIARWTRQVAAAQAAGHDLVPLARLPPELRRAHAVATFNHAFAEHWGMPRLAEAELDELVADDAVLDASLVAYDADEPVGIVLVVPGDPARAILAAGRTLDHREGVNFLSVGVHPAARGRGLGTALGARAFLTLAERGARAVGYTLVLDDNWASRRTGERLGAEVCAHYVAYRRALARPAGRVLPGSGGTGG
jgi:GNAT superfamily N-acetyltransferase